MSLSSVSFRSLMTRTAEAVGSHYFPTRGRAGDINEFLDDGAVHDVLIQQIVRSVYRASRCCHLDAPVDQWATLETLGAIRGQLVRCNGTDIDELHLVDAVGGAILATFQELGIRRSGRTAPEEIEDCVAGVTPTTRYCLVSEA